MALTINGKEYDPEKLSDEAKATLQSIVAVDAELKRLKALGAALQTARNAYSQALNKELEKMGD